MNNNVSIIEWNKNKSTGRLLYLYYYPHPIYDEKGNIKYFEDRVQRVGIITELGLIIHFTIPSKVIYD